MKQIRNLAIVLLTATVIFTGCFNQPDVSEVSGPGNNSTQLSKISLPVGASLDSAVFSVNVTGDNSFSNLTIHRITSSWTELGVTWNTQPTFDATPSASFASTIIDGAGWFNVDVTNLVQYWLNNPLQNFGLLLMQDNEVVRLYHSSEFPVQTIHPKLTVYYNGTESFTIQRGELGTVADAWIWSINPDDNYGADEYLRTINIPAQNYIKYSLFQFDYEFPPVVTTCSFSMGYWFAKPNLVWGKTVTVAGFTYTQAEGKAIWKTSNAGGMKHSKMGFLQVAAIKLSGVDASASVWADVAIVEAWLATLGKLSPSNLPTGNNAAMDAAGRIGDWIDANHCD